MKTWIRPLALLLCFWVSTAFQSAPVSEPDPAAWQAEMLSRVNALRAKGCRCGGRYMPPAPPLELNQNLSRAAQAHAEDMQRRDYFDHRSPEGESVGDRAHAAGYPWNYVGENIGWNYRDVAHVIRGWRDSPGHCRNMMNRNYTEMGVGIAGAYYVQVFGRSRSTDF